MVWSVLQELPEELVDGIFFHSWRPWCQLSDLRFASWITKTRRHCSWVCREAEQSLLVLSLPSTVVLLQGGPGGEVYVSQKSLCFDQFYFLVSNVIKIYYETIIL